jgi:hypothetical protein
MGLINQHPREAIQWMEGDRKDDILEFWRQMTEAYGE